MRSWFARLTLSAGAWSLSPWGWLTLVAVALCGLLLSIGASRSTRAADHEAERVRFERRVHDITSELQLHLDETARLLRSTAALFSASHDVSLADWHRFGQAQRLDDAFPGLLGLGEAPLVDAAQRPALEAAMRRSGLPRYTVRPAGERPFYAPVQFREPLDANRVALGFDLLSSPPRRAALERARDSGEPALATDLTLMRADREGHHGAILVLALYRSGAPLATVAQRRAALTGWVFAPIDLQVLMQQLVHGRADDLHVELWEGPHATAPIFAAGPAVAARSPLQVQRDLRLADRTWSLRLIEPAGAEGTGGDIDRSWPVLAAGFAITLLVMLLVAALLNMRGRAMALARRMSSAYRDSEARVRAVLDHAAEGILTVDAQGRILSANPVARRLLGLPAGSFDEQRLSARLQMDLTALMQQVDASPHGHWRGEIVQAPSADDGVGGPLTLLLAASAAQLDEGSHCYVLMLSDVTELRRERERADEAGRLNETILANAPFSVIATDKRGLIRSVNPAGERLLGYEAGELLGRNVLHTVMRADELAALAERTAREIGQPVDPRRVIGVRTLRGTREELEVSYRRKDGSDLPVMLALAPLRDRAGELTGFLGIAYDVTERKRSEAYIRHMAHHDELTGLPNRTLLQERTAAAIDAARAGGHHLAVLLIDLDRFKQINDSLGHHAGDVVLCSVAARLKHCLRSTDMVARMGGDEFVILLPQLDTPQQAERVAAKLLQAMVEPVQAGPHRLSVTPSIGIACFPRDGDDLTMLLRNADAAMYQSKGQGRNGYTLYTPQMHAASAQRLELEGELREALERGQLSLHYQPLVSLADGSVVGVEALLRWAHPERGNISPVDFIPIAEDTGLIVPIGEWVLRTACSDMRRLQQLTGRRLKVAVNLSPRQLRMPDVATMIADALRAADWPADALELEITESMVVENPDASIAVMQRLRAMGVGMAIDDFGTGYSSLSYLTRFPVAKLKLDRSFVRGLPHSERDAAIATSVVAMGHGLKLQVLAEGVETDAQMRFLRELGCEMGQGWLFAKAMPFDALLQHLAQADAPQQAIA
jgi:diguanylate cyclase (GGDEF)-like protein/PAS domain S-box-containing protein